MKIESYRKNVKIGLEIVTQAIKDAMEDPEIGVKEFHELEMYMEQMFDEI